MDCVFVLGDTCITMLQALLGAFLFAFLVFVFLVAPTIIQNLGDKQSDQIKQTEIVFERSVPETEQADVYEDEEQYKHPYMVGEMVFVGENEKLGAKLEVKSYDEEREEILCMLWIEAPIGSKCIRVRYIPETDYDLGSAEIEYTDAGGNGFTVEIGMGDEKIYNSDYSLVVEFSRSTFEDIREV